MARNDDKKTQRDPKNKGKGNENDDPLTNSPGSQSGQPDPSAGGDETGSDLARRPSARPPRAPILPPNTLTLGTSVNKIGQTEMSVVRRYTGAPMIKGMGLTRFAKKGVHGFSLPDPSGSAVSQDSGVANQLVGPGQALQGLFWAADEEKSVQEGSRRRLLELAPSTTNSRIFASRKRQLPTQEQKDQESSGQQEIDAEAEGDGQDQGSRPQKRRSQPFCVGCKSYRHCLDTCLKADADGYMKGCPFCNTLDHDASDCGPIESDEEIFIQFVKKRACMPSFLNFDKWFSLAFDYHYDSLTVQDRFPWTAEFINSFADEIDDLQYDLDTLGLEGEFRLPEDPKLAGWRAVQVYNDRRATEKRKALDALRETLVVDGVVMNKKRAAIVLSDDS
ncbi:hypothetical protein FMUND_12810 [Fusarium mundagurra]|uniref:Uncharacterized protein n=1 Tax=Fusarium mundagurra TaxID=1567541 RepID=A0A8H5Y125_9HYPO|nr:hypothetical protein FMUND_12810 [Fusarium mundagurra]